MQKGVLSYLGCSFFLTFAFIIFLFSTTQASAAETCPNWEDGEYWIGCFGPNQGGCRWLPPNADTKWQGIPDYTTMYPEGIPDASRRWYGGGLDTKYLYAHTSTEDPAGFKEFLENYAAGQTGEIFLLEFAAVPAPCKIYATGALQSGHNVPIDGTENFFSMVNYLEGGNQRLDCTNYPFDKVEDCVTQFRTINMVAAVDKTSMSVNLLRHTSCEDFSDLNPQFCEGAPGTGANNGNAVSNVVGVAGKGGCYVATYGETLGRDWFFNTESGNPDFNIGYEELDKEIPFASSFMPSNNPFMIQPEFKGIIQIQGSATGGEEITGDQVFKIQPTGGPAQFLTQFSQGSKESIGRCCGNDPEDYGAIISHNNLNFRHKFMCINNGTWGSIWAAANQAGKSFVIFPVERPLDGRNISYDVVSNGNNWFVCQGANYLGSLYSSASLDPYDNEWDPQSGPLLQEYQVVPPRLQTIDSYGVTEEPEGEEPEGWDSTSSSTDPPGSGIAADQSVPEDGFDNDINVIAGPDKVTACDTDGDGYDGNWSLEFGTLLYNPNLDCVPRQPYDCNENDRTVSPGTPDYCDGSDPSINTVNNDCAPGCIPLPPSGSPPSAFVGQTDFKVYQDRFMCHDIAGYGAFAECCGSDLTNCHNGWKGRREGSAIHTLHEFTNYKGQQGRGDVNLVLKYGIQTAPQTTENIDDEDIYWLHLPKASFDENVTDWNRYNSLEFDIYFAANFDLQIWLGHLNPDPEIVNDVEERNLFKNFQFKFKGRIVDYVVGEPALRKWLHVVIPTSEIYSESSFKVENIALVSKVMDVYNRKTIVSANIDGVHDFSNVIGLDKIILRPKYVLNPSDENYYCTGNWPPSWISDPDNSSLGNDGIQKGKTVCNSIPSYHWTGNSCCGDDNGQDASATVRGSASFKEFFNDTQGGCWGGRYLSNNERVMPIIFNTSTVSSEQNMNLSCYNYSCVFDLPLAPSIMVGNPHPDVYDLAFINGEHVRIGNQGISMSPIAMLKAENVPLQVQYTSGDFYTCNAAPYLFNLLNTNTGTQLIKQDSEHNFGACEAKGVYFCDHLDGKNHGWDDESLSTYPKNNTIIIKKGGAIETQILPEGSTHVKASLRTSIKRNYNFVNNGGFENV